MNTRLFSSLAVTWLICAGTCLADEQTSLLVNSPSGEEASKTGQPKGTSYASVFALRPGEPTLVVEYPWKAHAIPSVEVRLLTGELPEPAEIRPLVFMKNFMKGDVNIRVYRCYDHSASSPTRVAFTEKDIDFEAVGQRNSLGKPSVCLLHRITEGPAPGAGAVFCLLDSWAVNKGLLYFDLPKEYFPKPGTLRVWFFGRGDLVWSEMVAWPGY